MVPYTENIYALLHGLWQESKKNVLYQQLINKCQVCIANVNCEALDHNTSNSSQIETEVRDDCLISELRFSVFKEWFNSEVDKKISTALNDVIKTRILPINAEITELNTDLNDTEKGITTRS